MNKYEKRCLEYLNAVTELNNNIGYKNTKCFSDGRKMFQWYRDESYRLSNERKENINPSKERMEEIMMFSRIEDKLYELKKEEYKRRCIEYLELVTKNGKNIDSISKSYFSDGIDMLKWYRNQNSKLSNERKETIHPSKSRMEEIMMFAKIDDKLYELKKNEYERRCMEYLELVQKNGKNITSFSKQCFFDGIDMFKWYCNENYKLSNERKETIHPSKERMEEIMMFSRIEDKLYELKKEEYKRRCEEYLELIRKTKKHADPISESYFSDGVDMFNWYRNENKKLSRERKNNIYPRKKRIEEMMMFARITDELHKQKVKTI